MISFLTAIIIVVSEIDAKTIVVIGNGPSIANVDWSRLDCVDTFGINGSFKLWNDIGWYPTYQYIGRRHDKQWKDGLMQFINENECSKIFHNKLEYPWFTDYGRMMQPIYFMDYPDRNPDPDRFENTFMHDVGVALGMIAKTRGPDYVKKLVAEMPENIDNNFNVYGIFKILMKMPENIRECDYIKKPRFVKELLMPKSFDEFYYNGGMSGEIACLISILLGYKKIILIGCDNNFVINKDGTMRLKASYGVKDMFYGMKYNTREDIECPVCRTTEGLRRSMVTWWSHLAKLIEVWSLDVKVFNCNDHDGLAGVFPLKTDLEVFGRSIRKS